VSEQEHDQRDEETADEREETLKDLDVPKEEGKDVTGGAPQKWEAPNKT
jgi:hypothetical protein